MRENKLRLFEYLWREKSKAVRTVLEIIVEWRWKPKEKWLNAIESDMTAGACVDDVKYQIEG